ncbi:transposase [Parageobacillus genomosp. 1]|uniref:Transposase n=1 Tax=Parageobacillus genomosp. 1 TaxID=1295642 RepID=A0ABC9VJM4_9BACL|nr:transposase [Parageobacillus genomosp. 1]
MDTENREIVINLITIGSRCPIIKKRIFDKEYKIQVVELCLEGDKSITHVAKESGLDIPFHTPFLKPYLHQSCPVQLLLSLQVPQDEFHIKVSCCRPPG